MDALWREITPEIPDWAQLLRVAVRLVTAAVLGGLLGWEREVGRKAAGLRTHMLVAVGAALFIVVPAEAGMQVDDLSRVIQGIITGIGFLGAGTILKLSEEREIKGLTTAASIWLTAAIGVATGIGRLWAAILSVLLALLILNVLGRLEGRIQGNDRSR
jgi:putative Mg2+ transporter-C (MgtC) family protein